MMQSVKKKVREREKRLIFSLKLKYDKKNCTEKCFQKKKNRLKMNTRICDSVCVWAGEREGRYE